MLGVVTLEIVPPADDEKMPVKCVERVQVIVSQTKIVVLAHVPGQVRGKCRRKLRIRKCSEGCFRILRAGQSSHVPFGVPPQIRRKKNLPVI